MIFWHNHCSSSSGGTTELSGLSGTSIRNETFHSQASIPADFDTLPGLQ